MKRPEFHLTAVYQDGTQDPPQVVPVTEMPWRTVMDRRSSLGMGIGLTGVFDILFKAAAAASLTKQAQAAECVTGAFAHTAGIPAVAVSPDGRTLASGSSDNSIKLWSLPDGTLIKTLSGHTSFVYSVTISPDGRTLASASWDRTVKLWSLPDGSLLKTLSGHTDFLMSVAITPDGRTLASASYDRTIKLWSLPDGTLLKTLSGHTSTVQSVAISPDGEMLASGSADRTIRLWSLPDGALFKTLSGHTDLVCATAVSPDGRTLASASWDKTIRLWSLPDGTLLKTLSGDINSVAFSPDGRTLASASADKTVKLLSLPDGALLQTLPGHTDLVRSVAISPDGRLLASSSLDKAIRLWSLPDGSPLGTCMMDVASSTSQARGAVYTQGGDRYTVPCGTPLPAGAVCTCNCVGGTFTPPSTGGGSGGGGGGTICTCNRICTCNLISSRKWKTDIQPLASSIEKVQQLRPVSFDWTPDAPKGRSGSEIGFIAEELSEVAPESVLRDADGNPSSVDYARLTTLLVEAMKTQQSQIDELRNNVRILQERLCPLTSEAGAVIDFEMN